jgi:hypothetical protein
MVAALLPTLLLAAAALSLVAAYSSRGGVFAPVVQPGTADDTAETLAGGATGVMTVLNPPHTDWHMVTLHSLSEVEQLLDSLEAHGIAAREVTAVSNDTFTVRWK